MAKLAQSESSPEKKRLRAGYKRNRERLMQDRDRFIAGMINETLKEGEVGVLFIGSYHDALRYLEADIGVEQVKERAKVNAYFQEFLSGADSRFEQLGEYLISPLDP
jgi:hypothetical protein